MARSRSEIDALTCVNAWLADAQFDPPTAWVDDPTFALIDVGTAIRYIADQLQFAWIRDSKGHAVNLGNASANAALTALAGTLSVTIPGGGPFVAAFLASLLAALATSVASNIAALAAAQAAIINPA